jgi:hypothetical protein
MLILPDRAGSSHRGTFVRHNVPRIPRLRCR